MQLPDTPQIRARIALAREYGDRIKSVSAFYNTEVEKIWKRHLAMLKKAIASGSVTSAILDSLINALRELLAQVIENSVHLACEREEEDSTMQLILLQGSVAQCNITYYDEPLHKYKNILQQELLFAIEGGYSSDIDLFLLNPMGFMADKKNGLEGLKEGITGVSKGVSYSFMDNIKKLGISAAALAYTNALFDLWKGNGGMAGYFGVRNSSYPCALCDSYAHVFIPMSQGMIYPLHNRCVCSIVPLYQNELP